MISMVMHPAHMDSHRIQSQASSVAQFRWKAGRHARAYDQHGAIGVSSQASQVAAQQIEAAPPSPPQPQNPTGKNG